MRRLARSLLVLWLFVLAACGPRAASEPTPVPATPVAAAPAPEGETSAADPTAAVAPDEATTPYGWWNDTIFYEVFVRSYQDSDGDGVGDLEGLISRLDYLQELGVTGIWLMPITQSPSYHGYDVVDYYAVDDEYGTREAFERLIEEAHARDIRVIVDLVLNHTSSEHPWFLASTDPASDKRDWYRWADERPSGAGWHEGPNGDFYYGQFWEGMPDLNYENPDVTAQMKDVTRFWLEEMGVDGFRLDAIKFLIEEDGQLESTPATFAWFDAYYDFYKSVDPETFVVGEAWTGTLIASRYVDEAVDVVFEFDLAEAILGAVNSGRAATVEQTMETLIDAYPPGQYATFLANHDQTRTRTQVVTEEQAKLAATLLLTAPGVPFIYYGEEIGMKGTKPDENIRRPMQWTGEPGVGFTTGTPWNEPFDDFAERNVAAQESDPESLLNHYRTLIRLRNEHPALRTGAWLPVESGDRGLYAFLRHDEAETLLLLVHLGRDPLTAYALTLPDGPLTDAQATLLLGTGEVAAPTITPGGGFEGYRPLATLAPRTSYIIQLTP